MKKQELEDQLRDTLTSYTIDGKPLPGILSPDNLSSLVQQLIESISRVQFVSAIRTRDISLRRLDPKDIEYFDPLRAAIVHARMGNLDEAFWLVFLFVHCGKHLTRGYGLLRLIYGAFNDRFVWTWGKYSSEPDNFSLWLHDRLPEIEKIRKTIPFGNHRKYESIRMLDKVLASYAAWVGPKRSHEVMIENAKAAVGDDRKRLFDHLYRTMAAVQRFGRTGKFDYLTMLGKIGLVDIEAPSAYMVDATGPARGARLLFAGSTGAGIPGRRLDELTVALNETLNVGMQVIEDSLCNWQKSPDRFVPFRG